MTREEINNQINQKSTRINELMCELTKTDYIGIKIAEGAATKTEYADIRAQRQEWRSEINQLQDEIEALEREIPDDEPIVEG